jgi:hypothetical protein
MGYELVYDKNFIKVNDEGTEKFVPMIYGGSSNCFEFGRRGRNGRRSRSWFVYTNVTKNGFFETLDEMIASANRIKAGIIENNKETLKKYPDWEVYSDEQFGYFSGISFGGGCKSTFGQFIGLFKTGCRKALTVEELRDFGVYPRFHSCTFGKEETEKFEAAGKKHISHTVMTSAELVEKAKEFTEYLAGTDACLYLTIDADEHKMKRIRSTKFPVAKKEPLNVSVLPEYFVVKDTLQHNYVLRFTRNGYRFSHAGRCYCKRFATEKEANRYVKKANERYGEEGRFIAEKVLNENFVTT